MKVDITFDSAGLTLAGHLYGLDSPKKGARPAIVVGHPGAGVKEQAAGFYARELAKQGFIALSFDAAYQGESEGKPRGLEDPAHRVEDFKAAVSFLSVHEAVDPHNIGVLGICASGGYVISAAATDRRIKAVATVAAVDLGRNFRDGADGGQSSAMLSNMLDAAAAARTAQARGLTMDGMALFPIDEADARSRGPYALEGWEYYCTPRAHHPRSAKSFTWDSVDRIVSFDAFRFINLIAPRPLLLIAGTAAVTAWMSREAYAAADLPKELFWIDGASHCDLYDREPYVTQSVVKLTNFFRSELS
ncbi:alpha/beta hydrolase [Burkholderia vietnamiensis]|nr:alpha/beta hydrolase [Burkholderia vietnamiensis]